MKFFIKHMNGAGWAFSALLLAVMLVVCGCSESEATQAKGYVVAVPSLDDAVFPVLRSTNAPSDNEKIALEFYQGDVKVASVNDFRETISSPVSIPVRETRVVAKSATEKDAAWNSPAYYGETYIEPRENQTVVAEVICSISNVLVTAEFSSDITQNFSQWELKVDNGACSPLTFSKSAGNLADTAYFKATGTLHWKLSVTNNSGQQYKDIEGTYN
ncbi:MAG: DUF4493 domain-containing protein, partial [Bacteroidales bacterium]|nr:DUF4493 domain-containing protein [Bacteroidales bacterium]